MAHQVHNIPWHILATHCRAKAERCGSCKKGRVINERFICPQTRLRARDKPDQDEQIEHFIRCFVDTIREFADTERAKYPAKVRLPRRPPLIPGFAERYLARFEHPLPSMMDYHVYRLLESTQTFLDKPTEEWLDGDASIGVESSTLLIKALLDAEELETLLALAQHPKGRELLKKRALWGQAHRQGWLTVPETALAAYLLLNIMAAIPEAVTEPAPFLPISRFTSIYLNSWDNSDQLVAHVPFWSEFYLDWSKHCGPYSDGLFASSGDATRQQYLKKCFRTLYITDMIAREAGGRIEWEELLTAQLGYYMEDQRRFAKYGFYRSYTEDRAASTDNRLPWHTKRMDAKGESQGKRGGS